MKRHAKRAWLQGKAPHSAPSDPLSAYHACVHIWAHGFINLSFKLLGCLAGLAGCLAKVGWQQVSLQYWNWGTSRRISSCDPFVEKQVIDWHTAPKPFFCTVQKLCKFINRNVRSAICKQFERTRPRSFRSTGKTIPSKFNCPQFWAEILSSLSQKQSPSSALAECLRLPYESCSRAQPHVQMSDVTGTWQSKSNQNMRATNRSSCTDHYMSYVFSYFGFCNSALFIGPESDNWLCLSLTD